jgi:hypothetical protein
MSTIGGNVHATVAPFDDGPPDCPADGACSTGTIAQIVMRSPVNGGTARDLLVMLGAITVVTVFGVITMTLVAAGAVADPTVLVVLGCVGVAVFVPGAARRRRSRNRRRLQRVVGDPAALTGVWRRSLAAAWTARDRYAGAASADGSSPLWDRLADHEAVVDAALARCGVLARDGDLLERQLRGFRSRHLRRDLRAARLRDPHGPRARQLEARLVEVERLDACIRDVQVRLEAQVHDLRTAAWRATELRMRPVVDTDDSLADLLADLTHLREALEEMDAAPHPMPAVDTGHDAVGSPPASAGGLRYDV